MYKGTQCSATRWVDERFVICNFGYVWDIMLWLHSNNLFVGYTCLIQPLVITVESDQSASWSRQTTWTNLARLENERDHQTLNQRCHPCTL